MPTDKPWGVCNPNSDHQTWAKWVFVVHTHPSALRPLPDDATVLENASRFFGKLTRGASANLRMERPPAQKDGHYVRLVFTLRWDKRDVLGADFQTYVLAQVTTFMQHGFGLDTTVSLKDVKVEAGHAEDGREPAQLLVLPTIESQSVALGFGG